MKRKREKPLEYGQSWAVAVTMLDGPKTLTEIDEHFRVVRRRFGVFQDLHSHNPVYIREIVERLIRQGWVEESAAAGGNYLYRLTLVGRAEAETAYNEVKASREWVHNRLLNPITVSRVTLITHFVLALIKLPVGIVSGSVGLLNDGVDTLLDGLSSSLVYFGIRFKRERTVNIILITIMFATGLFAFYQGISRFFIPVEDRIDPLSFTAVIFSALISLILMIYQRYVGIKRNSFSLITQSVDSRNHLIVAGGVIVGMVGSLLNFAIVDTLVGIGVAVLICKGAVELLLEYIKGEEDASAYNIFGFSRRLFKKRLENWLLRQIKAGSVTRAELIASSQKALSFKDNITLESVGLDRFHEPEEILEETIAEMDGKGLIITEGEVLMLSAAAEEKIQYLNHLYDFGSYARYLFSYLTVIPLALVSFIILYYISLAGLSYLPTTHLWQGIDINLFKINFPWINRGYSFTLMNLVHLGAGLSLCLFAVIHFIRITVENHNARGQESRKPLKLITHGYYGQVRHPMYGMMMVIYAAFFFSHKSWLSLLIGVFLMVVFLLNGWYEERYELLPRFGEEYERYREKVSKGYLQKSMMIVLSVLLLTALAGIVF